jgi:hypothetical protein
MKTIKPRVHCSFECAGSEIPLDLQLLLGLEIPSPLITLKIVIQFKHI